LLHAFPAPALLCNPLPNSLPVWPFGKQRLFYALQTTLQTLGVAATSTSLLSTQSTVPGLYTTVCTLNNSTGTCQSEPSTCPVCATWFRIIIIIIIITKIIIIIITTTTTITTTIIVVTIMIMIMIIIIIITITMIIIITTLSNLVAVCKASLLQCLLYISLRRFC